MRSLFAAGLLTLGLAVTAIPAAQAAPLSTAPQSFAADVKSGLAEPAGYRNYCGRWRGECARRWGWGGWRFRRCLSFHGCL